MSTVALILMIVYVAFTLAMIVKLVRDWSHLKGRELLADLDAEAKKIEELAAAKARLMRDIKELEFDHQMGHLSDEDYGQLRKKLERKTIRVMKKLDALRGDTDFDAQIDQGLDSRFGIVFGDEPEVDEPEALAPVPVSEPIQQGDPKAAMASTEPGKAQCGSCGWMMDAGAAFCSQCGEEMGHHCVACGASMDKDARFCSECGTPAAAPAMAEAKASGAPSSTGELG